ncbi:hypothetical protein NQ317_010849 [Molorchus minor]|uniref:Uncharacterized protein n=1 Tax=Molorchus minor TaxID=1323400 RepID=A0ABQ9JY71_9CUCU|nr:hypothetical protein NQ317_010849 [Molorchus minor]
MTEKGLYSIFPGDDLYPENIENRNPNITDKININNCSVQNRAFSSDNYVTKLFIQNLSTKDRHLPPYENQ